jgi:para-nitrobenzyl esterase
MDMRATGTRFFVGLMAALAIAACASAPGADRVRTSAGIVEGLGRQASGVRLFHGIPFAAPPVADLRWREPQPAAPWQGVRDAKSFGARCMQAPLFSDMMFRSPSVSEDCLYLNVWTPAHSAGEKRAVLLYFYGGGLLAGDGSEYRYDGEALAARGIVVVTMNYRLGAFGFMAHPELTAESPHHASGNYGFLDQIAALDWVRANIAAFGGDPARIIVAGESAGSVSANAMMASPLSRDHVAGAIGESGSLLGTLSPATLAEGETMGASFAARLGAGSLAALRALPAQQILAASGADGAPRFGPVIDGYVFPKSPRAIYEAGEQSHAPLLVGANSAEGDASWLLGPNQPTVANYRAALATAYKANADAVFARYPAASDGEPVLAAAQDLASDTFIGQSTWAWTDFSARAGAPVYYYYYAQKRPPAPVAPNPRGAVHSAEIEYALGNLATNNVYAWTDEDRAVSELMQNYFVNFVKTGDPNGEGLPAWPTYQSGQRLIIEGNTRAEPFTARARYEFMDQFFK